MKKPANGFAVRRSNPYHRLNTNWVNYIRTETVCHRITNFAYVWYSVAAKHQHKKSMDAIQSIRTELSGDELKEADKLIPDYVEKYGPKEKVDRNKPVKLQ